MGTETTVHTENATEAVHTENATEVADLNLPAMVTPDRSGEALFQKANYSLSVVHRCDGRTPKDEEVSSSESATFTAVDVENTSAVDVERSARQMDIRRRLESASAESSALRTKVRRLLVGQFVVIQLMVMLVYPLYWMGFNNT